MNRRGRIIGAVIQVPEEVSRLANRIRRHYDPNFSRIGPHVTVLPPREVFLSRRRVREAAARVARTTRPFAIALGRVGTFRPVMPVVFAGFNDGVPSLTRLHRRLARGALKGHEVFPYVPHLTLGQSLDPGRLRRALALSRKRFGQPAAKPWVVDRLVVVERVTEELWVPLPPLPLNGGRRGRRSARARKAGHARRAKT